MVIPVLENRDLTPLPSRNGTLSLTSLLKDGGVSCFGLSSGKRPSRFCSTQACLASVKLMRLAGTAWPLSLLKNLLLKKP